MIEIRRHDRHTSTVDSVGAAGARPATRHRWWALSFLVTGNLTVFTAVTTMNVAIPQAQAALGFSDSTRAAVLTLYSLCFGTFMLLGGRLADVLGLRRCLSTGLIGFAIASALGGFASSVHFLLIARAFQGITGALVAASGLAMISVMFPGGRERVRAFGLYGMVMGMGTAASFTVAGALVVAASWRWVMFINIPLALIVTLGVIGFAPALPAARGSRLRIGSAALITAALGLLVVGLDQAGTNGWGHGPAGALLGAAAIVLAGFVVVMRRSQDPLIPLFLFGERRRLSAFCAVFLIGIGVFAGMFMLTSVLQDVLGYTPLRTGAAFLPWGLAAIVGARALGAVKTRVPVDVTLAAGMLMVAAAIASLALLTSGTTYLTGILPAMLLLGAGSTAVMVTGTSTATMNVGEHNGVAGALVNASQQVGAAVGTALLAAIITSTLQSELTSGRSEGAMITAYATASGVGAVLIAVGALGVVALSRIAPRSPSPARPRRS